MEPINYKALIIISVIAIPVLIWAYRYIRKVDSEYERIKLNVIIEKTNTGYSCYCNEIDGVIGAGDTIREVKTDFCESLDNYIDYKNTHVANSMGDLLYLSDYEITYIEE